MRVFTDRFSMDSTRQTKPYPHDSHLMKMHTKLDQYFTHFKGLILNLFWGKTQDGYAQIITSPPVSFLLKNKKRKNTS